MNSTLNVYCRQLKYFANIGFSICNKSSQLQVIVNNTKDDIINRYVKRLLHKSDDDKKLDGVCAGVAEYLDVDPTVVRVGYALLTIITGIGPGVICYLVLSLIIPNKSEVQSYGKENRKA